MLKRIARVLRYTQVVALLLVGILGVVVVDSSVRFDRADESVEQSHEVINQLDLLRAAALRSSVALRSYAIAPKPNMLEQARTAMEAANAAAARVVELTQAKPDQQVRLQEMNSEIAEVMGWLSSSIVIAERDGANALRGLLVERVNSDNTRRLREVLDALEARERQLLQERRIGQREQLRRLKQLAVIAGVLFTAFLCWSYFYSSQLMRLSVATFDELKSSAFLDPLTGLLNRRGLLKGLRALEGRPLTVLAFDLDRFKPVNDQHGHAAGDEVLRAVASRLQSLSRDEDLLARVGGDEFLVVLPDIENPDDAAHIAERLSRELGQPVRIGELELSIGASIGVATLGRDADDFAELSKVADQRSYEAKIAKRAALAAAIE